jgi:thioredoxin 1
MPEDQPSRPVDLDAGETLDLAREAAIGAAQLDRGETAEFTAKDIQELGRKIFAAGEYRRIGVAAAAKLIEERSMANANILEFTDQNFQQEVLQAGEPVLVDFTAVWCPPCRALAPTIEKLANEYAGKAKVGKMDADANRDVLLRYRIEALPTVLVFRGGQVSHQLRGLRSEKDYREALENGDSPSKAP